MAMEATELTPKQQEAMEVEMTRLETENPATAEALRRAESQATGEGVEKAEREATDRALKTPVKKDPPKRRPTRRTTPRRQTSRAAVDEGVSRLREASEPDSDAEDGRPDLRAGIQALGEAGQRGARRGRPLEDDWTEFMAVLFGFLSLLFIWWLTNGVGPMSAQERESLELSDEEAEGLARPAARILARSALNDRYGKDILGATDYVIMAVVMVGYAERVSPAIKRKMNVTGPRKTKKEMPREREREVVAHEDHGTEPQRAFVPWPLGSQYT